jgi:hypothetical protein
MNPLLVALALIAYVSTIWRAMRGEPGPLIGLSITLALFVAVCGTGYLLTNGH